MASVSYSIFASGSATDPGAYPKATTAVTGSTVTYYSEIWSGGGQGYSLRVNYAGTPTGTTTLWEANKTFPDLTSDTDWTDVSASVTVVSPAGSATSFSADVATGRGRRMRLKYINASGSGTIEAHVTPHGR